MIEGKLIFIYRLFVDFMYYYIEHNLVH